MNTQKLYDIALTWLVTMGPRILLALILFIAGQWLIRLLRRWTDHALQRRNFAPSLRPFLLSFLFTVLQILLLIALLQLLGIQMSIFAALVASIGVAIGLALSGTLQNFTSGLLILALKPYRVGDNIIAQGQEGTVTSIQLFYTIIRTYDNKSVIIPNSKLSNELIINISHIGSRRLDTELKFGFAVPFQQVKGVVEQAVSEYGRVRKEPPLRIGVSEILPDGYTIVVNTWMPAHGFEDERLAFREKLLHVLTRSGIPLA